MGAMAWAPNPCAGAVPGPRRTRAPSAPGLPSFRNGLALAVRVQQVVGNRAAERFGPIPILRSREPPESTPTRESRSASVQSERGFVSRAATANPPGRRVTKAGAGVVSVKSARPSRSQAWIAQIPFKPNKILGAVGKSTKVGVSRRRERRANSQARGNGRAVSHRPAHPGASRPQRRRRSRHGRAWYLSASPRQPGRRSLRAPTDRVRSIRSDPPRRPAVPEPLPTRRDDD